MTYSKPNRRTPERSTPTRRLLRVVCGALLVALLLSLVVAGPARGEGNAPEVPSYEKDVKPILARHCGSCHGTLAQESGLRLDAIQLIRQGGDSGEPLLTEDPADSWLLAVVTGEAGFRMPPEGDGTALEPAQVEVLRRWLAAGAPAPDQEEVLEDPRDHWSYQPVERPVVPTLSAARQAWVRNPIDAFVAAQHEAQGLQPHPSAPDEVLLRRLYLDLIGIPPTLEQLEAFLADPSQNKYEETVERLLASPQYGERWARHWLDIWRYSDWYGRRNSNEIRYSQRHIWRWRDWTVDALNEDRGYDYMIHAMLAGDELAPGDPETLRATGYVGRNWYKFDRDVWMRELVEHTAMGMLGMTLRCARCHDHKYDPIAQEEYYRFRAFFEPHDVRIDSIGGQADLEKDGLARVYDKQLDAPTYLFQRGDDRFPDKDNPLSPGVPSALGDFELQIQPVDLPLDAWYPVELKLAEAEQAFQKAQDHCRDVESRIVKAREALQLAQQREQEAAGAELPPAPDTADTQQVFLHDSFDSELPDTWQNRGGTWKYGEGKLQQTAVTSWATRFTQADHPGDFRAAVRYVTNEPGNYRSVGVFFDMVDTQHAQAVYTSISGGRSSVQAFHRTEGREEYPPAGIFPCKNIELGKEILLELEVRGSQLTVWTNGEKQFEYTMPLARRTGRFAIWSHSGTADFLDVRITSLAPTAATAKSELVLAEQDLRIGQQRARVAERQKEQLLATIRAERSRTSRDPQPQQQQKLAREAASAEAAVALAQAQLEHLQVEIELARAMDDVRQTELEKKLAERASAVEQARQTLEEDRVEYTALKAEYPQVSSGRRLALARWMTAPENPRTARVACNHIWLRHFGQALVPSVSNFGLSGKEPSHPQLLDWLSSELMAHDWSLKHLHRLIVTSQTYRLHSAPNPAGSEASRIARNREADPENRFLWRANYRRMEAEVVRDSLLALTDSLDRTLGGPDLPPETAGQSRRRSLYFRVTPDDKVEFLEIFDLANPDQCYQRQISVVPHQALALTNSKLSLDQARQLAQLLSSRFSSSDAFVTAVYRRVLGREPTADEAAACREFLEASSQADAAEGPAFPAVPSEPRPAATTAEQRARENLVHVILNHNDFITIR